MGRGWEGGERFFLLFFVFFNVFIYLLIFARPLEDLSVHGPLCVVKHSKRGGLLCEN